MKLQPNATSALTSTEPIDSVPSSSLLPAHLQHDEGAADEAHQQMAERVQKVLPS